MRHILFALGVLVAGCSGEDAPSCQQAMTTYYGRQCTFIDSSTGRSIPQAEMIGQCQGVAVEVAGRCDSEFDAWLICLDSVEGQTTAGCDCSAEFQALLVCGS